jgi:hypothetical protein
LPGLKAWALSLAGPVNWTELAPNGRIPSAQYPIKAVMDRKRGRVLFHGAGPNGTIDQTWAFYLDETTPALLSLVDAEATTARVRLRWYAGGAMPGAATLERRSDDAGWATIARLLPDGTGMLTFDDFDVTAGQRYDYRLLVGTRTYGNVTVTIPAAVATLRLAAANPVMGDVQVSFELPVGGPATLELLDVSGRRVLARRLDGMGAGAHVLTLSGRRTAPGMYFLRLVQGAQAVTRKIAIAG